ncbi:MAG: tripartite tricarboxylate transporter substrate binding protein [Burkholderiales bacterium]|nr:tripartite tricarboxylate transporter substrate binding protein [Burkholderiales bacterium]
MAWARACVGLALAVAAGAALAQEYPGARTVKIIVPFAPGSATDALARIIGDQLQRALGGTFVIDNQAGANGVIAAQAAARATPDGHTLFVSTNTTHSANPHLVKDLPYDPLKDFSPVARLTSGQFILVVPPALPARSLSELVALARERPGKLSYATSNATSLVAPEWLKALAGLDILSVPYKSNATAVTDLLAARVDMMFMDQANAVPMVRAGKLRALATSGGRRAALLPEVPTVAEGGFAGYALNSWAGLFAPAGTPPALIERLTQATRAALRAPDVLERLQGLGYEVIYAAPGELAQVAHEQHALWGRAISAAKVPRQ